MNPKKKKSSLVESEGVIQTANTNQKAKAALKHNTQLDSSPDIIYKEILKGNIAALSQAITLVESANSAHQEKSTQILSLCLGHSGNSIRIGITGVPGVGKSTFIEAFGQNLIKVGKKVAILAVDPTSQKTKGSILGDKTRMERLSRNENAFIRPTPSGESLGGVARKTRETIILCEAGGFDTILIETVGVGQSEIAVHSMVDFFLLLKLAGAGDELQGIKRGIIEMADLIAINKADGDNLKSAKLAKQDFKNALHLYPPKESGWHTDVFLCSSTEKNGLKDIGIEIDNFVKHVKENGYFIKNRERQQEFWLLQTIEDRLKTNFFSRPKIQEELKIQLQLIKENKITAFNAANYILNL